MGLTHEAIIDAAVDLVAEVGVEGLSMRSLAQRLGVSQMAAYRHFAGRDHLVQEVGRRVAAMVRPQPPVDADWTERVRCWAREMRVLRSYPGMARWLMLHGPVGPEAYAVLDHLLEAVSHAGFDEQSTAEVSATIMSWVFSRIAVEDGLAGDPRVVEDRSEEFTTGIGDLPTDLPRVVAVGPHFFALGGEDLFWLGIEALLRR